MTGIHVRQSASDDQENMPHADFRLATDRAKPLHERGHARLYALQAGLRVGLSAETLALVFGEFGKITTAEVAELARTIEPWEELSFETERDPACAVCRHPDADRVLPFLAEVPGGEEVMALWPSLHPARVIHHMTSCPHGVERGRRQKDRVRLMVRQHLDQRNAIETAKEEVLSEQREKLTKNRLRAGCPEGRHPLPEPGTIHCPIKNCGVQFDVTSANGAALGAWVWKRSSRFGKYAGRQLDIGQLFRLEGGRTDSKLVNQGLILPFHGSHAEECATCSGLFAGIEHLARHQANQHGSEVTVD